MRGFSRRLFNRYGKKAWVFVALGIIVIVSIGGGAYAALGGFSRPQSSSDIELQRGLVGWWKLDGNTKDSTPYGNDGTTSTSVPTTDRKGRANAAYAMNTGTTPITVASASVLHPTAAVTVSAWVMSTEDIETNIAQVLASTKNNGGFALAITGTSDYSGCGTGNLCFYMRGGGVDLAASATTASLGMTSGVWYHVTGTFDGTTMRLYLNGAQVATTAYSGSIDPSTSPFCIEAEAQSSSCVGGDKLNGSIDDVRLYNRALSAAEVGALYDQYDSGVSTASGEKGLVGWWKLDGNAKDSTPYADNGTITGTTTVADRHGYTSGALHWQGAPDEVMVADAPILNPTTAMTVSAWFYAPNVNTGVQRIVSKFASGGYSLYMTGTGTGDGCGDNNLCAKVRVNGSDVYASVPGSTLNNQNWYHLAMTYDGTNVRLYVTGSVVATSASTSGSITTASVPLCFGANNATCGSNFLDSASIDDVRLYNRALSSTEVTNLYNSYDSQINLNSNPTNTVGGGNINQGLVGYWPFSGNAKDATPYADNGTLENGPVLTTDRFGRASSAYLFNAASSQDIAIPDSAAISPTAAMSLCAWFSGTVQNTGGTPVGVVIKDIGGSPAQNPIYGFQIVNGSVTFVTTTNANVNNGVSHGGLLDNTWYQVCGTSDGTTIRLYVNGAAQSSQAQGPPDDSTGSLRIGQQKNGFNRYFTGSIDDVRLYNRALSATEVQTLYASDN